MEVNYRNMLQKNDVNAAQERVLQFFWLNHPKKWTADEVFKQFRAKYPTIGRNTIAPRISELKTKGLLEKVGEKVYQHMNPLTKKVTNKKQDYLRILDITIPLTLFD